LGAIDYLPKPIDAGMFLHRVETLVQHDRADALSLVPLAKLPAVQLGNHPAQPKRSARAGSLCNRPAGRPAIGEVVDLASPVFDECGIQRRMRGRWCASPTLRERRTNGIVVRGLHERDLCGIGDSACGGSGE
jgi:hypothetical protein